MNVLYSSGIPRSRGSNRNNNYMASSVNRRNDNIYGTQNYNNYYGNSSIAKDPKPSYLSSIGNNAGILPKISQNDKREE